MYVLSKDPLPMDVEFMLYDSLEVGDSTFHLSYPSYVAPRPSVQSWRCSKALKRPLLPSMKCSPLHFRPLVVRDPVHPTWDSYLTICAQFLQAKTAETTAETRVQEETEKMKKTQKGALLL